MSLKFHFYGGFSVKLLSLLMLVLLSSVTPANAQLFGQRKLGQPLTRQPRAGIAPNTTAAAGEITGTERFVRGNRDKSSFVGADQTDSRAFVGNQQGSMGGTIISSTAGIAPAPDRSAEINQAIEIPPAKTMYLPKIIIGTDIIDQNGSLDNHQAINAVRKSVRLASKQQIEVSLVNGTAILRGVVISSKEKCLAETLALFVPGISKVENELQVHLSLPQPETLPSPLQSHPTLQHLEKQ